MNSETLIHMLQKSFRVTLGATSSLIEVLQDPQKRNENLTKLQQEWSQLSEEWADKGAVTEQEARNFVDNLLSQRSGTGTTAASSYASSTTTPTASPDIQIELQELTAQIAAIRTELEKLRNPESPT